MQALTEMVPEMFIKGYCLGRERTRDTQVAQEAVLWGLGRAVCLEQRACDRLLLDEGGHLCHGSEAGKGWNDLFPTLI